MLQCYIDTVRVTPTRVGRPKNALNIRNVSDLSEIDEDIVRGEHRDGAGDDVEHGLYLGENLISNSKLKENEKVGETSPDKSVSTHLSCQ